MDVDQPAFMATWRALNCFSYPSHDNPTQTCISSTLFTTQSEISFEAIRGGSIHKGVGLPSSSSTLTTSTSSIYILESNLSFLDKRPHCKVSSASFKPVSVSSSKSASDSHCQLPLIAKNCFNRLASVHQIYLVTYRIQTLCTTFKFLHNFPLLIFRHLRHHHYTTRNFECTR